MKWSLAVQLIHGLVRKTNTKLLAYNEAVSIIYYPVQESGYIKQIKLFKLYAKNASTESIGSLLLLLSCLRADHCSYLYMQFKIIQYFKEHIFITVHYIIPPLRCYLEYLFIMWLENIIKSHLSQFFQIGKILFLCSWKIYCLEIGRRSKQSIKLWGSGVH